MEGKIFPDILLIGSTNTITVCTVWYMRGKGQISEKSSSPHAMHVLTCLPFPCGFKRLKRQWQYVIYYYPLSIHKERYLIYYYSICWISFFWLFWLYVCTHFFSEPWVIFAWCCMDGVKSYWAQWNIAFN